MKELLFLVEPMGNKAFQLTLKSHICFNVCVEVLKNKPQLVNSLALKVHFTVYIYHTNMRTSILFGLRKSKVWASQWNLRFPVETYREENCIIYNDM